LTKTVDGVHATVVVVGCTPTVIVNVPELAEWFASAL